MIATITEGELRNGTLMMTVIYVVIARDDAPACMEHSLGLSSSP